MGKGNGGIGGRGAERGLWFYIFSFTSFISFASSTSFESPNFNFKSL